MIRHLFACAGLLWATPLIADPGGIPALNPSFVIPPGTAGTRVLPRIDSNADTSGLADVAIVWTETGALDGDASGVFLSRNGEPEELVNTLTIGTQQNPDVSVAADGSVTVAWVHAGSEVHWRTFDPAGGGGGVEQTAFTGVAPSVAYYPDGRFIVAGIAKRGVGLQFNDTLQDMPGPQHGCEDSGQDEPVNLSA